MSSSPKLWSLSDARNRGAALVTGASGFIGTRLVASLAADGIPVIAADVAPPRKRLAGVRYIDWDVRRHAPHEIGDQVGAIFNLAAIHRTPGHPTDDYYETNILGATHVTKFAREHDINLIVFTSSISVYGPSEVVLDEQSPLQPVSAYGKSKRIAELIHSDWASQEENRRLAIVRPGVVFGPGERRNYSSLPAALSRGVFFYPGRKDTVKSGGYVDELISTMQFVLARGERAVTYNFAYPRESTTRDIVKTFAEVSGFKGKHAVVPVAPLYIAASIFEMANHFGLSNPIHRERVLKLVSSTRVQPKWLETHDYHFKTNLKSALIAWRDETGNVFS